MPKIRLDSARIDAVVGELVAGRVPQHVRVDRKRQLRGAPSAGDKLMNAASEAYERRERKTAPHVPR